MAQGIRTILAATGLMVLSSPAVWSSPLTSRSPAFTHSETPPPAGWVPPAGSPPIPEIIEVPTDIMFSMVANANLSAAPHPSFFKDAPDFAWSKEKRTIFGPDDRQPQFDMDSYPFSATGRVQRQEGNSCSGALVGPRHVATARHCYREGQWISFAPQYSGRDVRGTFYATQIFRTSKLLPGDCWTACDFRDDFIILVMGDNRLGEQYGHFGAKMLESNMVNAAPFRSLGYPGDRDGAQRPYRQDRVNMHRFTDCESGPMATTMDGNAGQSGSPMWLHWGDGGVYQFGVHSASWDHEAQAASGVNFVNTVIRARQDFP